MSRSWLFLFLSVVIIVVVISVLESLENEENEIPSFRNKGSLVHAGEGAITYYCYPNEELQERNKKVDAKFESCISWTRNYTFAEGYSEPNGYLFSDYCINRDCKDSIKLQEVG